MATAGDMRGSGPERAFADVLPAAGEVELDAEESSHLVRARRVREADAIVLFDGRGRTMLATLVRADPRRAVARIVAPYADREPGRRVTLCVSLPEAGRTDRLVAQLAELGVTSLMPLMCARTPAGRMDQVARRRERWLKLTREAGKSSGRSRLLEILEPSTLEALIEAQKEAVVLLDPDPALPRLPEVLARLTVPPWIAVGPEGGFTGEEVACASMSLRARLGETALRTETAALAAAAVATSLPP